MTGLWANRPRWLGGQRASVRAPEGQGVTFVELFFDLVFVFALTEVTALVVHDLTWAGAARAALVFSLVWWAWTQFTWALNGADTNHPLLRAGTLVATAVAFLMAIAVDGAFAADGGPWFVVPYVVVRVLGLALYLGVARGDRDWFSAVRAFGTLSLLGLAAATVGGFADPDTRVYWFLGTIVLDLVAASIGGRQAAWNLDAAHFAERHGLFVIIALGESLIATALPAVGVERSPALMAVLLGALGLVCLLWWTYFGWFQSALEGHLAGASGRGDAPFARDAYSLLHLPLVLGVIGVAVGLEAMVAHPADAMTAEARLAFGLGLALFLGSTVFMWLRARAGVLVWRVAAVALTGLTLWLVGAASPAMVLAVACAGVLVLVAAEGTRGGRATWRAPAA